MNKETMSDLIISTKAAKSLTWEKIATDLGMSPVWLTSACLGMNSAPEEKAKAIADYLGLGPGSHRCSCRLPNKNLGSSRANRPTCLPAL